VRPFGAAANPWFSWDYVTSSWQVVGQALIEHLWLTFASVAGATLLALPLAIAAVRWRILATPFLVAAGILYTIPALALITGLWPIFGLTTTTVIVALMLYSLLVILRNTIVGIEGVPREVLTAARAMGYGEWGALVRVAFPVAFPAVIAGIKLATVSTVGLVMIGSLIGHGGLGSIVLGGFINNFYRAPIVIGTVLTVVLAFALEFGLTRLQRRLTPWTVAR
jgi:osmoprotectant transport system permease protein